MFDDSAAAVFLPPPGRHAQLDLDPFTGSGPIFFATPHPNFHPNPPPPPPNHPQAQQRKKVCHHTRGLRFPPPRPKRTRGPLKTRHRRHLPAEMRRSCRLFPALKVFGNSQQFGRHINTCGRSIGSQSQRVNDRLHNFAAHSVRYPNQYAPSFDRHSNRLLFDNIEHVNSPVPAHGSVYGSGPYRTSAQS